MQRSVCLLQRSLLCWSLLTSVLALEYTLQIGAENVFSQLSRLLFRPAALTKVGGWSVEGVGSRASRSGSGPEALVVVCSACTEILTLELLLRFVSIHARRPAGKTPLPRRV